MFESLTARLCDFLPGATRDTDVNEDDEDDDSTPDVSPADERAGSMAKNGWDFTDPEATVTFDGGHTVTMTDFSVDYESSFDDVETRMNEVSSGLVEGDREMDFQVSLEVPTKSLECTNCGHLNEVPAFQLKTVKFTGDLEPLSGEYAIGHQCDNCGFPH